MLLVNQVRASHILINHQGSRRKASWKDPGGSVITSTTCDSADSQLKALREDVLSAKFEDLAASLPLQLREVWRRSTVNQGSGQIMKEYQQYPGGGKNHLGASLSHVVGANESRESGQILRILAPSMEKKKSHLGPFGRGPMQKPFEEVTLALKVGEISDIVDTDSRVPHHHEDRLMFSKNQMNF